MMLPMLPKQYSSNFFLKRRKMKIIFSQ